jgi:hypothetical protein
MKNQQSEQIEFDLDPQPESSPALPKPEPESVPLSSEKEHVCPQCEIFGTCPRCARKDNPIHIIPKTPISNLDTKDLDEINAEMMSRSPKIDPPLTPEEIEGFFKQTKKELDDLDKRRAS